MEGGFGDLSGLEALFAKLIEQEIDGETYCLRKITEWLAANGTPRGDYRHANTKVSRSLYSSGIYLKLNEDFELSIQTEPTVSGKAFCETALIAASGLTYDSSLGYHDVCRWDEPEDLFQHIVEIRQKLKDRQVERAPEDSDSCAA